jgi:hypothetical protein
MESIVYDQSMSPEPIDIMQIPYEERGVDIFTAEEDLKALVCHYVLTNRASVIFLHSACLKAECHVI